MNAFLRQVVVLMVVLVALLGGGQQSVQAQTLEVNGVRFGGNESETRFVLDVTSAVKPRIFLLADPYRVVIDLPGANWKAGNGAQTVGLVNGFRHGLFTNDTYRLVLDLKSPAVVKKSFALSPNSRYGHRYVIDLEAASRSAFVAAVQKSRPARPTREKTTVAELSTRKKPAGAKKVIVLDAGHGGPDPGNLGSIGVHEKHITLKLVRAMAAELRRSGKYEVKLTRNRDIFIPVRKRFVLARQMGADLFVSVHADALDNRKVRGGTVYSLSETASDKEAARLAARENKSDVIAGLDLEETDDDVSGILIELAQRETMNYSAQFAEILVPEMRREVRMHKRGHRYANLGVLKAPDVPSVLVEGGYLTNKADARMLNSKEGQRKLAVALRRAIDKYFDQQSALGR